MHTVKEKAASAAAVKAGAKAEDGGSESGMKNRIHLYINRTDAAAWLVGIGMLASAAARIVDLAQNGGSLWLHCLLPAFAAVLYGAVVLITGGEMLYKTAVSVWLLGVCNAVQFCRYTGKAVADSIVFCAASLAFGVVYTLTISGRLRRGWLIAVDVAALAACIVCGWQLATPAACVADGSFLLGVLVLAIAARIHDDGAYHPTWGDRADGRMIRSSPVIERLVPYIMVDRNGANNLFAESVEISAIEDYIRRKRKEGLTGFGLTHVIFAAYARTVAKYPALNRFISGQKIYSRGEDIALCMTVKKEMALASPDTVVKVHLTPVDTAEDVYRKFGEQVEKAKDEMQSSGVDDTAGILTAIPGLVLKFVVWLLKTLDYFGLVPGFLLEISPFHGSAYFTSMASLGIRPVYHHLYDFGNVPVFCAFGKKRRATEIVDGEAVERRYVDLHFTLDERICDGYYYASLLKYFLRLLKHPELLDAPPETVERDIP